jgi:predicted lipoprotein
MQKKAVKTVVYLSILLVVLYLSISIQNLTEYKSTQKRPSFDPQTYAQTYWLSTVQSGLELAVGLDFLDSILQKDGGEAFDRLGKTLSIGNIRYFLVTGNALVQGATEDYIDLLIINGKNERKVRLEVEFIYGNAVRDVFGAIDLNEFESTADLNRVSESINEIIKAEVVSPFLQEVKNGDTIHFVGVIELNRNHMNFDDLEIIPLRLSVFPNQ